MTPTFTRRGFLFGSTALIGSTLLGSCKGKTPDPVTPTPPVAPKNISCFGDSLTAGSGGTPYATLLTPMLTGRTATAYGIGGQVAQQIAARQGGIDITMTLEGNAFSGTNPVKATSVSTQFLSTPATLNKITATGTLAGVKCTVSRIATLTGTVQTESYTVTPSASSTQAIPANSIFIPDSAVTTRGDVQVLWMGRNNAPNMAGVDALIDSCIAHIADTKQYLVIGVLNGVNETTVTSPSIYKLIADFNTPLAQKHGTKYVPATPPTTAEMAALGYTPTAVDLSDIAAGTIPTGMRFDKLHLNNIGYQLIANRVAVALKANNY